jgi:hypothetical protein
LKIDIGGSGGQSPKEKRREGPKTYLGQGMAGFSSFHDHRTGKPSVPTFDSNELWSIRVLPLSIGSLK